MGDVDKLYMKALKAVAKERRTSTGRKIPAAERGTAKLFAKWASESPVYAAIEGKKRLPMPAKEEVKKLTRMHAMKEITRGYRSGWNRKKVAPEHRESIIKQAGDIAERGDTFIPRRTAAAIEAASMQKKNVPLARLGSEWMRIDNVIGKKDDGSAFLIAPGSGFDAHRIIVFASYDDEAYEIAQEKIPKLMFSEIISRKALDKLEGKDPSEAERYTFIESLGKWGLPEEDIRIFKKVTEFVRGAKKIRAHADIYRLPDGRIVEAR